MKYLSSLPSVLTKGLLSSKKSDEIYKLRERLLRVLLYGAILPGLAVYYIGIRDSLALQEWGLIIAYTLAFGWTLIIAFTRRLSFYFRAGSLVGLLYILGSGVSMLFGLGGDGRIWMLGFTILTAVFFSPQLSILVALLSTMTLVGIGWALNQHLIPTQALFIDDVKQGI